MRHWLAKSLKRKLTLLLLVAVIVPLLATGIVSYRIASSVTEEKEKLVGMNMLREVADKLDFVMEDVENMSLFLIGQKEIQSYLDQDDPDYSRFSLNIGFLTNLAFSKKYIANITITSAKGHPPLSNTAILHSQLPDLLAQHSDQYEQQSKWWSPTYQATTSDGLKQVISLVRQIRSVNNYQPLGTLAISIDETQIRKSIEDMTWEKKGYVVLADQNNRVLSSVNREWLNVSMEEIVPQLELGSSPSGTVNHVIGNSRNTILHYTLPRQGWKLIGVIPTEVYTSQNKYVLNVTAVAIVAGLVITLALVMYFIYWVTHPLTKLAQTMKNVNPDETVPIYPIKNKDEVGLLFHSFNKFSQRIQRLKEQVQINEGKKREADILALQAQIHPHFLYNTLSSIHWLSLMSKDKKISDMVGALSNFLRLSLNKGKDFHAVQQEIAHAKSYAQIMSIRFKDQFQVTFDVDSELMQLPIVKLLLQPLIENSIMHGVQRDREKIQIYVHGKWLGNAMTFAVEDTGAGIPADQLLHIQTLLQDGEHGLALAEGSTNEKTAQEQSPYGGSGYGLRNVMHRLQLHYGHDVRMQIDSKPNAGTRVSFTIPIAEDGHENHDR